MEKKNGNLYNGLYRGYIGVYRVLWRLYRDNGKENLNYKNGLYRDYYKDPCLYS